MNNTEPDFRASGHAPSQNDKLEAHFRAHTNEWLDMPSLALVITPTGIGAAVHSRVSDLRTKRGMNIEQKQNFETTDGVSACCSRYRFVPNNLPPSGIDRTQPAANVETTAEGGANLPVPVLAEPSLPSSKRQDPGGSREMECSSLPVKDGTARESTSSECRSVKADSGTAKASVTLAAGNSLLQAMLL